jgi:hypothetical protein
VVGWMDRWVDGWMDGRKHTELWISRVRKEVSKFHGEAHVTNIPVGTYNLQENIGSLFLFNCNGCNEFAESSLEASNDGFPVTTGKHFCACALLVVFEVGSFLTKHAGSSFHTPVC